MAGNEAAGTARHGMFLFFRQEAGEKMAAGTAAALAGYGWDYDWDSDEAYEQELEAYGGPESDFAEELGSYEDDLAGDQGAGQGPEAAARSERAAGPAFLLNSSDEARSRPDSKQIQENFRRYVRDVNSGDPVRVASAKEGACKDLEFFMINLINRFFNSYTEKDRDFFFDLMQAGYEGIVASLPKYDPEKGMPTTYFYNPIKHEMVLQVNQMKHGTKSHIATAKKKIREVDRKFAEYGRKPTVHDYAFMTQTPYRRVMNALAELRAGNTQTSLDSTDAPQIADPQQAIMGPDESAISQYNTLRIVQIAKEIEPRKEIVACFLDTVMNGKTKASDLARQYGVPQAEISDAVSKLANLLRYHPEMRKMYPERFRIRENELDDRIMAIPVDSGRLAMRSVMDSMTGDGEAEIDLAFS